MSAEQLPSWNEALSTSQEALARRHSEREVSAAGPSCPSSSMLARAGRVQRARFVGRDAEFAALDAALQKAVRFRAPQLLTIIGQLGIGKTRLLHEWLSEVEGPGLRVLRLSLSTFAGAPNAARGNLIGALVRHRFGIEPQMGPEAALAQFRTELRRVFGDRRVAEVGALLGRFLGFDLRESPLSQVFANTPRQGADLARAVLCRFFEVDAEACPLVIAIDDLHLGDDHALDILDKVVGELGEAAVFLVATARPDLLLRRPDWGNGQGGKVRLPLGPLSTPETDALVRSLLDAEGAVELPEELLDRAARESVGNPYLLEQLLHLYTRQGVLVAEAADSWSFDGARAAGMTLSLSPAEAAQSRVSALSPPERELLMRAAVFGPTFWTGGLVALSRLDAEPSDPTGVFAPDASIVQTRAVLAELEARDVLVAVEPSTIGGDAEWTFKHAGDIELLLGQVDGTRLVRQRRFAAQWLETRSSSQSDARLELLGDLYDRGRDPRRAAHCLAAAAAAAHRRGELEVARTFYLRASALMELDDAGAKMDALYALGDVTARLGRTREAVSHFQEMLRMAWRLDLPGKGGAAHGRIGRLHATLGEHRAALAHLQLARDLFDAAADLPGIASALDDIGRVQLLSGAPEASLECHRAAYRVREQLGDERGKALALSRMGQVEHETGDLLAAQGHVRQAIDLRRRIGDRPGMVASLLDLGALERDLGRVERAVAILEEARSLAREGGEHLFECSIAIALGDCWLGHGRPGDARAWFIEAKSIARRFGAKLLACEAARGLAEADLARGDLIDARDEARSAFETAERIGAPQVAGAALRVVASAVGMGAAGEVDLGGPREMFDRAIAILSNGGAELELGRALSAYAEYEQRCGRKKAARELRRQAESIRLQSRGGRAKTTPVRQGRTFATDVLMKDGIAAVG